MRPLFSMVSRDGRSWGQAWSLTPAIEAVLLEQRRICDDGGPDNVQVIAYSSHGRPLGPIMLAAQTTLARHCRLLVEPETPAPAPPPERESAHVHAQVSVQEVIEVDFAMPAGVAIADLEQQDVSGRGLWLLSLPRAEASELCSVFDQMSMTLGRFVPPGDDEPKAAVVHDEPDDLSADGRKHGGGAGE